MLLFDGFLFEKMMKRTSYVFISVAIFACFHNVQASPLGEVPMEIDEERKPQLKRLLEGVTDEGDVTKILQIGSRAHSKKLSCVALFRPQYRAAAIKHHNCIRETAAPHLSALLEGVNDPKEMDEILDSGVSLPSNRLKFVKAMEVVPSLRVAALGAIKDTPHENITRSRALFLKALFEGMDKCEEPLKTMKALMRLSPEKRTLIEETDFEPRHRLVVFALGANLTPDSAPRLKTLLVGVDDSVDSFGFTHAGQIVRRGVSLSVEQLDHVLREDFAPNHRYAALWNEENLTQENIPILKNLLTGVDGFMEAWSVMHYGAGLPLERLLFVQKAAFLPNHRASALRYSSTLEKEMIAPLKDLLVGITEADGGVIGNGALLPITTLCAVRDAGFQPRHRAWILEFLAENRNEPFVKERAPYIDTLLTGMTDLSDVDPLVRIGLSLSPEYLDFALATDYDPNDRAYVVQVLSGVAQHLTTEKLLPIKDLMEGVKDCCDVGHIIRCAAPLPLEKLHIVAKAGFAAEHRMEILDLLKEVSPAKMAP